MRYKRGRGAPPGRATSGGVSSSLRRAAIVAAALAVALSVGAGAVSASNLGPDLVITSLSPAPSTHLAPGSAFSEHFTEKNIGKRSAGASTTGFYLSSSAKLGKGATRLRGAVAIPALKPGQQTTATAKLTIPTKMAPGSYYLIGCADVLRQVSEVNEGNNCLTASGRVRVVCHPTDNPALTSPNPHCFDGNAADGIFVSASTGVDSNPGTRAQPKRTLAAGVNAAAAVDRDVYVTEGTYPELVQVANGVSVYGGYSASWQRSPANVTKVTGATTSSGDTEAAEAFSVTSPTTVQLLTLSPGTPITPGANSYGLRGSGDTGLVLDHLTVVAGPGVSGAGGGNGSTGIAGGDGITRVGYIQGGAGGSSAVGHTGGAGGWGTQNGGAGQDGATGQLTYPDAYGLMGGPGGPGGAAGTTDSGGKGYDGDFGKFLGNGSGGGAGDAAPAGAAYWLTASGTSGAKGSDGHGGGGGGGGGAACDTCPGAGGGGGGGGGQGGGGGGGGQGGGGSFGIFLVNSAGAMVQNSSVTASDGGAGGAGGGGAYGGVGGAGGPAQSGNCGCDGGGGGAGGRGGTGGRGGDGGGGAGGPSIAIFGLTAAAAPGTTATAGSGGSAGAGGYGSGFGAPAGANGVSAQFYP